MRPMCLVLALGSTTGLACKAKVPAITEPFTEIDLDGIVWRKDS